MSAFAYPDTRRDDVIEDLHGVPVADPYRWLEDTDRADTADWVAAQNGLTQAWLAEVSARDAIRARLTALWDRPRRLAPWRRGGRWFQLRNTGLQDQDVLWTMEAADAEGRVLVDPNELSEVGTVALDEVAVSRDGCLLAYATSDAGSDWQTWRVRDIESGEDLPDVVEWGKFSPAAWLPDGSGFFYGRFDPPPPGATYAARNQDQKLCLHRLGTSQEADELVHERPDRPDWGFAPRVTHDGRYLVLHVWEGTQPYNRIHYRELGADGPFVALLDEGDARYELVGTIGDVWYFLTDLDAPKGRVVAIDVARPDRTSWREVVPEAEDTLERARLVGDRVVAVYLHHATHRVRLFLTDGSAAGEVELPGLGQVAWLHGDEDDTEVTLTFETFVHPVAVLHHDLETGRTSELFPPGIDGDGFVAEQVFAVSADGTRVPMFLVCRADVRPTGDVPTVLWGYGGFDIAVTPTFKVAWRVWVEMGGMLAVANLRGGGEYGQVWHDAGRLANKQNVFDDFVACAEWLCASGWTRRERLAIEGRSNGGLLVGACMTQRPDLFGACVPEVGVLDMLRFHRFTIGWAWVSDYGSSDDPEQFGWLHAYSPYHNVREGTCYPATLITTGDHDDRVVPAHSFKFAAALQAAQGCANPVLIRIDVSAGHGLGKPVSKLVAERTDVLAFYVRALAMTPDLP